MKRGISAVFGLAMGVALVVISVGGTAFAQSTAPNTPEIDAGSAASALTLLVGGAMLLRDRLRVK